MSTSSSLPVSSRLKHYDYNGLAEYVQMDKYMRYRPDLKRRETFEEAVTRVEDMHVNKFYGTGVNAYIYRAFNAVRLKEVWPSSRAMQFGGNAVELENCRQYNCSAVALDKFESFRDFMFMSLCGVGVGISVRSQHVGLIPNFPVRGKEEDLEVKHYSVHDSKEGWADVVYELLKSYYFNYHLEPSYEQIRKRGSLLKTSGGKAPGHIPLKNCLEKIRKILDQCSGRGLKSIEAHDLCMFMSEAVLSAGVRRVAVLSLFSPDDAEMMDAKTGNWFQENPQRAYANNSAAILRDGSNFEEYCTLFDKQIGFGEPGFFFCESHDDLSNPCLEVSLSPIITVDKDNFNELNRLLHDHQRSGRGYQVNFAEVERFNIGDRLSGVQFCNLSMINGAKVKDKKHFLESCKHASVIGTIQAAYTDFPYLGPVTEFITRREALLGVSISGFFDDPAILLNAAVLREGAKVVKDTNKQIAAMIGINPAARTTCVKPDGTGALVLGSASGITPHHAKNYFRRVQATRGGAIYEFFKKHNPQMCEQGVYSKTDDVITFPVSAPRGAILRKDIDALAHLKAIKLVQDNWVIPGQRHTKYTKCHHNVSNTVTFQPPATTLWGKALEFFNKPEWKKVRQYIWDNRNTFTGVSLLQQAGDKIYQQAPREEVLTNEDIEKWNSLNPVPVDYSELVEYTDDTHLAENLACAGGMCEIQ